MLWILFVPFCARCAPAPLLCATRFLRMPARHYLLLVASFSLCCAKSKELCRFLLCAYLPSALSHAAFSAVCLSLERSRQLSVSTYVWVHAYVLHVNTYTRRSICTTPGASTHTLPVCSTIVHAFAFPGSASLGPCPWSVAPVPPFAPPVLLPALPSHYFRAPFLYLARVVLVESPSTLFVRKSRSRLRKGVGLLHISFLRRHLGVSAVKFWPLAVFPAYKNVGGDLSLIAGG